MEIVPILKTVAPWIATALGSPLAGLAVEAATRALGASEKTTEGLKAALAGASPADMLALKKADQEFQAQMAELGYKKLVDLERITADDRKDARGMQKETRSNVPAILSTVVTVGFFGILVGIMAKWLSVSDNQALLIMLGALGASWANVMQFWFGTTNDSGRKTDMLAKAQPIK